MIESTISSRQAHDAGAPQDESEIDVPLPRARYAAERARRQRPDATTQYRRASGEFGYYARDPYTPREEREPRLDTVEVLVIGAGIGGLLTGARLREAGFDSIRLMDEGGDVGGTWYWNRYPGIRCDVESYLYMPLLEEVGYMPKERYATGEEIRQHLMSIARKFDLYQDALFQTRATALDWDESAQNWIVATDRGDRFRARYVVTSSGQFSAPKLPGIPGIEAFHGHTFHTSRWDYGYTRGTQDGDLTGLADKRVAVIGTGATGVQVVPIVARDAKELLVFQRTPSSIGVRDNRPTDPEWAASLEPGWQKARMENFLAILAGAPVDEQLVDDGWTSTATIQRQMTSGAVDESVSDEERELRDELLDFKTMNQLRARVDQVVVDPSTAERLKPWYRYMCKRPCFSDLYLQAFNRDNVTLVDTADTMGITRMTETSIIVGDDEYEVDCVIFATGFETGSSGLLSGELPAIGSDGRSFLESWAGGPRTLHGFYSDGFPNLFTLGPIQNGTSVNFSHILQEQASHITAVLTRARDAGAGRVEPRTEAVDAWVTHLRTTARDNSAFLTECTPGYYNSEGATAGTAGVTFSPGPVVFHSLLHEWRSGDMSDVLVR